MTRSEFFQGDEWAIGTMVLMQEVSSRSLYEVVQITDAGVALTFRCGNDCDFYTFQNLADWKAIPVGKFIRGWFGSRRMVFDERATVTL